MDKSRGGKQRQTTLFNFLNKAGAVEKHIKLEPTSNDDISMKVAAEGAPSGTDALITSTAENHTSVKRTISESDIENEPSRKKPTTVSVDDTGAGENVLESDKTSGKKSPWNKGEAVPYSALCDAFDAISTTTKRLEIAAILTKFLKNVILLTPESLLECVYLCLNKIAPEYEGKEMGLGESLLVKAIAKTTGREASKIKADFVLEGDLGIVAQNSKRNQMTLGRATPLTVSKVFRSFKEITLMAGNSVITALGHAAALAEYGPVSLEEQDKAADTIKRVYCQLPNYELIIAALLSKGIKELPNNCKLTPGVPLKPMLAHPTKSISEVLDRFENISFTCEYKYDGERAQIHLKDDGSICVFSRNSENLSAKYPDVIALLPSVIGDGVTSCVMDCEAVAWDTKQGCILPFQILSTRKRKDGQFAFAKSIDAQSLDAIQTFLDDSISQNCEGLMVKTLENDSSYEPSVRSRNWLKVKKDYIDGCGDSLDLVVIGGYYGRGKRTGWYGGYLLACYDEDAESYQSICKIATGFSEEDLKRHHETLSKHVISTAPSYYNVCENVKPDVWFQPTEVWEVKAADLSISPVHQAAIGLVDPSKGISLRFPRFIRIREDKNCDQATSSEQVADMYRAQNINKSSARNDEDDLE